MHELQSLGIELPCTAAMHSCRTDCRTGSRNDLTGTRTHLHANEQIGSSEILVGAPAQLHKGQAQIVHKQEEVQDRPEQHEAN